MQHLKPLLLFPIIVLSAIIFFSCQDGPTMAPENQTITALNKFVLPEGATIDNATLYVYSLNPKGNDVYAHNITSEWDECVVTWNSFNESFDAADVGSFSNVEPAGWKSVDITTLVAGWVDGTITNLGVLLKEDITDPGYIWLRSQYDSREGTHPPYLEITYTNGGSHTVTDVPTEDVYIWQLNPNTNYCSEDILYTGTKMPNQKKYSMLKFEFEFIPQDEGCTLTPGYWKTHSIYGPAPYDDTWLQVGEDSPFFLSEKSYYQVLWTSPSGNAYYNLSFHYIAAKLNFLNGANPNAAQAAFEEATELFELYTPAQIAALNGNNPIRKQFISLAGILGNYNEGFIGPGHCDD